MALIRCDIRHKLKTLRVNDFVWLLSFEMSMSGVKYLCSVLYHPPKKEDAKFMDFLTNISMKLVV